MLNRPRWVDFGGEDLLQLRYLWDDARVHLDFRGDAAEVLSAALRISTRAQMVLSIGFYEWIVWRFDGLHQRAEPIQILEAAWCGTVDSRYLAFFELPREEWLGPVEGPLWNALTYLSNGIAEGADYPAELYDALQFLYLLAVHVVPAQAPFEQWVNSTLKRFLDTYPKQPEDPFDNVFGRRVGEMLGGPLIGRDALDPHLPTNVVRDQLFLARLLEEASSSKNPFVATPEDLADLEFEGTPYVLAT